MSSYLCEDETFDRLASTLGMLAQNCSNMMEWNGTARASQFVLEYPDLEAFARELYEMNLAALVARYGEDAKSDDYGYEPKAGAWIHKQEQLYKTLQCLTYQCSEGDIPNTMLYKRLEKIIDALAHDIVTNSAEYDKAQWA